MIKVDQTTFGHPGGNCFSACVASLLELPISEVPYFMGPPESEWYSRFEDWLIPRGFWPVTFRIDNGFIPSGMCILGGKSSRGDHAVVGRGREVVHDPHFSREGLLSFEDCTLLVPFDPALMKRRPS